METLPLNGAHMENEDQGSDVRSQDQNRTALLWDEGIERSMTNFMQKAAASSAKHRKLAFRRRRYHRTLSVIGLMLPTSATIAGALRGASSCVTDPIVLSITTIATCVASLTMFMEFGPVAQRHFEFAARWDELASHIEIELAKSRPFRIDADIFVTRVTDTHARLKAAEPA